MAGRRATIPAIPDGWKQLSPLEWEHVYVDGRGSPVTVKIDSYNPRAHWRAQYHRNGTHLRPDIDVGKERAKASGGPPRAIMRVALGIAHRLYPPPPPAA